VALCSYIFNSVMRCVVVGALALASLLTHAQALAPIPPLTERVVDTTLTLGSQERADLIAKLKAFEDRKGSQIAVLVVASTQPEDITSYALRAAQAYKVGRAGVGDGILIVVAKDDRRVRIDVAKALEGAVPDVSAGRIVRDTFRPAFRDGQYAQGLSQGVDQLIALVDGEALPEPERNGNASVPGTQVFGGFSWFDLGIFLFMAVFVGGSVLRGMFGRGFGSLLTGGLGGGVAWWLTSSVLIGVVAGSVALVVSLFAALGSALSQAGRRSSRSRGGWDVPIIFSGGGGGGGFGGGGGWSSGGGGDFGGGGASGDW
jgi:uncharacterized protein